MRTSASSAAPLSYSQRQSSFVPEPRSSHARAVTSRNLQIYHPCFPVFVSAPVKPSPTSAPTLLPCHLYYGVVS